MRAAYLEGKQFRLGENLKVDGDIYHHLANVIRLRKDEKIMLLDGKGSTALARVADIGKRDIQLSIEEVKAAVIQDCPHDVLILVPKRDALDSMLKIATEMGVRRIYLLKGHYSPEKLPEERRVHALLQSALEQSNNAWLPDVIHCQGWDDFPANLYSEILLMDVDQGHCEKAGTVRMPGQSTVLVVGPEGGYSPEERRQMLSWPQSRIVTLATPILRAPTALAAGLGWLHARA